MVNKGRSRSQPRLRRGKRGTETTTHGPRRSPARGDDRACRGWRLLADRARAQQRPAPNDRTACRGTGYEVEEEGNSSDASRGLWTLGCGELAELPPRLSKSFGWVAAASVGGCDSDPPPVGLKPGVDSALEKATRPDTGTHRRRRGTASRHHQPPLSSTPCPSLGSVTESSFVCGHYRH